MIVLTFSFTGCITSGRTQKDVVQTTTMPTEKSNYKDIDTDNEKENRNYKATEILFGYNSLTTQVQKNFYTELCKSVWEVSEDATSEGYYPCKMVNFDGVVLTQAEIRLVISAVKIDNPIVFWLSDHFGYSNTSGFTTIQLYSLIPPMEIKEKSDKMVNVANSIVTSMEGGLDEFTLELRIHDKILEMCKYADDVKSSKDDYLAFTVYGVLVNGSAVCEGYSKTFQYLMSQLGIECTTIMGRGKTELHMWNSVKINGNFYFVDVSWDDSKEYSKYDYFNITEEQLLKDHTISKEYKDATNDELCGTNGKTALNFNHSVPKCNSVEENYYVKCTPHFTDLYSYDNPEMTNALFESANSGDNYFSFYIDPMYLEYTNAVDQLFNSGDQLFFSYIDTVNSMYPANYIDKEQVYIVQKENLYVVTVQLKYQ